MKLHCTFYCSVYISESQQADDGEGKLFTSARESETAGFCLVHRAFYVKTIRWPEYNQPFFPI